MAETGGILKRILRIVFDRQSAQQVGRQLEDTLKDSGKKSGNAFLKELRDAFTRRMADLKVQLAKGLISPAEFKKQGDAAAKAFNQGVLSGMERARAAGSLTNAEYLKLSGTLKKVGDDGQSMGDRLKGAAAHATAWLAGLFALHKVADFFKETIKEAIEAQLSITRLADALEKVGISYANVAPRIEDAVSAIHGFADDDARLALANLITITGDYTKSLDLLSLTSDLAAKRHIGLAEASEVVGKASIGIVRGLGEFGIKTNDTATAIEKLRAAIGGLNEREAKTFAGRIKEINILWKEFKEKVGLAIIGTNGAAGSVGRLEAALRSLNTWTATNSGAISFFIDKLIAGASALGKFVARAVAALPQIEPLAKVFGALAGRANKAATAQAEATKALEAGTATRRNLTAEEQRALSKLIGDGSGERVALTKAEAAAIEAIYRDAGAGKLTLNKEQDEAIAAFRKERAAAGIAEQKQAVKDGEAAITAVRDLAASEQMRHYAAWYREYIQLLNQFNAEILRLENAAAKNRTGAAEKAVAEAKARRDKAIADRLAEQTEQTPEVTQRGIEIRPLTPEEMLVPPSAAAKNAKSFETPYIRAMGHIQNEIDNTQGLFAELGQAAADGGIMGIAKWAKVKVLENVALGIENAAKALASLAIGNAASASLYGKAAAGNALAAAEWGALAGVAGAVAGGSGSGGGGTTTPNTAAGGNAEPVGPEITIVLDGPGFDAMNPKVQRVVLGAQQQAREIWGQNARVRVIQGKK